MNYKFKYSGTLTVCITSHMCSYVLAYCSHFCVDQFMSIQSLIQKYDNFVVESTKNICWFGVIMKSCYRKHSSNVAHFTSFLFISPTCSTFFYNKCCKIISAIANSFLKARKCSWPHVDITSVFLPSAILLPLSLNTVQSIPTLKFPW